MNVNPTLAATMEHALMVTQISAASVVVGGKAKRAAYATVTATEVLVVTVAPVRISDTHISVAAPLIGKAPLVIYVSSNIYIFISARLVLKFNSPHQFDIK